VTYLDDLSRLSFGQLAETLPTAFDDGALRRHYRLVVGAKTGTLFRLACSYGGTAGGVDDHGLQALMRYADQLAFGFQVMDDVRDVEGDISLGKEAGGDLDRRIPTWPVIEWLASDTDSHSMWRSIQTTRAAIQADLVRSGATEVARSAAVDAAEAACQALELFPETRARTYLCDFAARAVSR
jgi:geranylgeranyl pyrophosphate synthase